MNADDKLDEFIRGIRPAPQISPERLERLIYSTLDNLPLQRNVTWLHWPQWFGRYAVPMATAALLGLIIGTYVLPVAESTYTGLYYNSSTVLAGF